jgi:catechol 2,3-dioxygenase-like lactoylglutathione lyase family enzyme
MSELRTYRGIHHVGITVPNMEDAEEFFTEVLGCKVFYREGPFRDSATDSMALELGVDPRAELRTTVVIDTTGTLVELLEYTVPGDEAGEPPLNSSNSACHLALTVDDIEAAVHQLRDDSRVSFLRGPARTDGGPSDGMKWIYCTAPWGLTLELIELPPQLAGQFGTTTMRAGSESLAGPAQRDSPASDESGRIS